MIKTITVNQNELIKDIYQHCPSYFYNFQEGECCQRKVTKKTCNLHLFSEDLHCPLDCPRLNTNEYGCDRGKCPKVKATIKQLKTQII